MDLNPLQAGVHMSRFEEIVNEAIDEVVIGEAFKAEGLAAHIAERVRERQQGLRAEVTIRARYPEHKQTPVSGLTTQELYTLIGTAVASERGVRRLVGVEAQGMTACPCAQELVADASRERLVEQGFTDDEIERVFEAVPVATHNQRGIGSLYVGCPEGCDTECGAETLLRIVEESMSSEIFELMKRSDERAVVEKAHRRPRFVEDCVREMLRGLIDAPTRSSTDTPSCSRARRTSRRSTSTTSSPSATGCSRRSAPSSTREHALAPSRDDARVAREPLRLNALLAGRDPRAARATSSSFGADVAARGLRDNPIARGGARRRPAAPRALA